MASSMADSDDRKPTLATRHRPLYIPLPSVLTYLSATPDLALKGSLDQMMGHRAYSFVMPREED